MNTPQPNHSNVQTEKLPFWKLGSLLQLILHLKAESFLIERFLHSSRREPVLKIIETVDDLRKRAEQGDSEAFKELTLVAVNVTNCLNRATRLHPEMAREIAPSLPAWPLPFFRHEALNAMNHELVNQIGVSADLKISQKVLQHLHSRSGIMIVLLHLSEALRRMVMRDKSNPVERKEAASTGVSPIPGSKQHRRMIKRTAFETYHKTQKDSATLSWFLYGKQAAKSNLTWAQRVNRFWASVFRYLGQLGIK